VTADNRDAALAYQVGLGLSFKMNESFLLDLGYKMLGIVEPNIGNLDPDYLTMHNGNAGFRFLF
jgi:opacity protein-like surface antigen